MQHFLILIKTTLAVYAISWSLQAVAQVPLSPPVQLTQADMVSQWIVSVAGDSRQRALNITGASAKGTGVFLADGKYGYANQKLQAVDVNFTQTDAGPQIKLTTPANSAIVASRLPDGSYVGTITMDNGAVKAVSLRNQTAQLQQTTVAADSGLAKSPGQAIEKSRIRFINMGGNDCPPCVAWRALELPKLQASTVFKGVNYSYVIKSIWSPVPSEMFLDAEVKPLKAKLDTAGGGRGGSAQQVLVVDNEVYDYWFGSMDAKDLEARVTAISSGTSYPGPRCVRYFPATRTCAEVK